MHNDTALAQQTNLELAKKRINDRDDAGCKILRMNIGRLWIMARDEFSRISHEARRSVTQQWLVKLIALHIIGYNTCEFHRYLS